MLERLRRIWTWLLRLFFGGYPEIAIRFVDDTPEELRSRVLYVIGDKLSPWKAALMCPCGCNETIELNLSPPGRPLWHVIVSKSGVSVRPSIWRTKGCRSHFWIRNGRIEWCMNKDAAVFDYKAN